MSYSLMYIFQIITNQPLHLWSACGMRAHRLAKEEELEAGVARGPGPRVATTRPC